MPLRTRIKAKYTIRDIAAIAGVSRSTVSLALNDSPKINSKTKAEIVALMEKIGYRPNQAARNLARRSSGFVCVILPHADDVLSGRLAEVLSGITEASVSRGLYLLVQIASTEFKQHGGALRLYRQRTIDGVLCVGSLTTDNYLAELARAGCPTVIVNGEFENVPNVIANNRSAAIEAVKHLHKLGHRRIAHIRGNECVTTAVHCTEGYLRALNDLGLQARGEYDVAGLSDHQSGYEAAQCLLRCAEPPTAIFCATDMMAIGALQAIRDSGLRVPDDVALVGGDDAMPGRFVAPAITTLHQPMYAIGRTACEQLFKLLDGHPCQTSVEMDVELVIRDSCGGRGMRLASVM